MVFLFMLMVVFNGSIKDVVVFFIFSLFFIVFIVIGSVVMDDVVERVIVWGFFIVMRNDLVDVFVNSCIKSG